ncbi:MAG: hypothetical protein PUC11_02305 [Elusimicrobia bacterium]|nr:hypothetical protein [Elusimicrobiota bacterium]
MPNKEERICIFKENFDSSITEIEGPQYMTRSEAVERMAKAACKANRRCIGGVCETCTNMPKEYIHSSEAALDALLGGKNG